MNYRHIYHAGNHADVLKHAVLLATLSRMMRKDAPLAVIETHAGIGIYDLSRDEAVRSPEWRTGIALAMDSADHALGPLQAAVLRINPSGELGRYPGSPELCRQVLRQQDRYVGCELHPEDAATLKARYGGDKRMQLHARDGWEALGALLPPAERRGLVLIDPPYEQLGELARAALAIRSAAARFRQGVYLWWRPVKDRGELDGADAALLGGMRLEAAEIVLQTEPPRLGGRLVGSSVLVINPPFGLEQDLQALASALGSIFAQAPGARCASRMIAPQ
jgi:23S rRNA (adenine2030-N6)-methyltransferase